VSEPAELLPEPFTLLAGPAAPYVRLGASMADSDDIRLDVEPRVASPAEPRVASPAEPRVASSAEPQADLSVEPTSAAEPAAGAAAAVAPPAAPAPSATRPRPTTRVASGRGVTGRGIVVLILVVTGVVGLLEVAIAGHRGHAFGIAFVVSSAIGALIVRRRDLPTALIAPPLLYCVLIVAMSVVDHHDAAGGRLTREGVYLGNAFVTGAPALWTGTLAAALVAGYRWWAARRTTSAS
jgi:hypothetical protein